MAVTRDTSGFGDGSSVELGEDFRWTRKQNLQIEQRAHRQLQCWSRILARAKFEPNTNCGLFELPDSASSEHNASTTETDSGDID